LSRDEPNGNDSRSSSWPCLLLDALHFTLVSFIQIQCHRLARWIVPFLATNGVAIKGMPSLAEGIVSLSAGGNLAIDPSEPDSWHLSARCSSQEPNHPQGKPAGLFCAEGLYSTRKIDWYNTPNGL
jgi:hypothetical protein